MNAIGSHEHRCVQPQGGVTRKPRALALGTRGETNLKGPKSRDSSSSQACPPFVLVGVTARWGV